MFLEKYKRSLKLMSSRVFVAMVGKVNVKHVSLSLKKLLAVLLFATLSVSLVPAAAQIVTEALNTTEERGWNYVAEKIGDTTSSEFHGKWVNYLSSDNTGWKAIDTRFYRTLDGFQMQDAPFEVYLPLTSGGIATFHNNNKWDVFNKKIIDDVPLDMTIQALGVQDVPGRAEFGDLNAPEGLMKNVSYVVYPDAYANGDLIYYIHHGRAPRLEKLIRFTSILSATSADGKTANYYFKLKYAGATDNPEFSIDQNGSKKPWDKEHDEVLEEGNEAGLISAGSPTTQILDLGDFGGRTAQILSDESSSTPQETTTSSISADTATSTPAETASLTFPSVSHFDPPAGGEESHASSPPPTATTTPVIPTNAGIQNNNDSINNNSSSIESATSISNPEPLTSNNSSSTPIEAPASTTPAYLEFSSAVLAKDETVIPNGFLADLGSNSIIYNNKVTDPSFRWNDNRPILLALADNAASSSPSETATSSESGSPTTQILDSGDSGGQTAPILSDESSTTQEISASSTASGDSASSTPSVIPAHAGIQNNERNLDNNELDSRLRGNDGSNNADKPDDAIKDVVFKKARLSLKEGKPISVLAPTSSGLRGIGMKQFQIWDSNFTIGADGMIHRKKQNIAVELQPTENAGEYILTKIIPIDFFASSTMPVYTDTTTTFYPNANPESTSVDGKASASVSYFDWATIRGTTGCPSCFDDSATTFSVMGLTYQEASTTELPCDTGTSGWLGLGVGFYLFDTSALTSSATLSSATFSVFGQSSGGNTFNTSIVVTNSNPDSNTAIAGADYSDHTTQMATEYGASRLANGSFSTSAYNNFSLNATGLSNVSKTSITKLGTRSSADFDNTDPTSDQCAGALDVDNPIAYSADQTGTSNDPKLAVTYTLPATDAPQMNWNFLYNFLGLALAKSI